jgi:hypothetical protein
MILLRVFFYPNFRKKSVLFVQKDRQFCSGHSFITFSDTATKTLHCVTSTVFHLSLGAAADSISDAVHTQKVATALWQISKGQSQF